MRSGAAPFSTQPGVEALGLRASVSHIGGNTCIVAERSAEEPTSLAFVAVVTERREPEQPPPPTLCVLPFHAPSTPEVPPSALSSGSPPLILILCFSPGSYPCSGPPRDENVELD